MRKRDKKGDLSLNTYVTKAIGRNVHTSSCTRQPGNDILSIFVTSHGLFPVEEFSTETTVEAQCLVVDCVENIYNKTFHIFTVD